MRVLVTSKSFGRAAPEALELLAANGIEVVRGSRPSLSAAEIAAEIPGFDALVVGNDPVDAGVLAAGDRLRLVHMHGTGLDAIDVHAATARGVLVANAPGANRNAVAELTVALMLVAARSIDRHIDILKSGRWERTPGREISGKTVGILGLGRIGQRIVELLSGFGVRTVAFDVAPDRDWAAQHAVTLAADADAVCAEADFLVLALSLNAQTRNFIDARRLALMKPGAYLVNTARGGLIVEADVAAACRSGRLAGYAADVLDEEPMRPGHPFQDIDSILVTPHVGSRTFESVERQALRAVTNLVEFLNGGQDYIQANRFDP